MTVKDITDVSKGCQWTVVKSRAGEAVVCKDRAFQKAGGSSAGRQWAKELARGQGPGATGSLQSTAMRIFKVLII